MGKKRKIKKRIAGITKAIEEHRQKINEYDDKKDHLKPYWEKEISSLEEERLFEEKRLKKK